MPFAVSPQHLSFIAQVVNVQFAPHEGIDGNGAMQAMSHTQGRCSHVWRPLQLQMPCTCWTEISHPGGRNGFLPRSHTSLPTLRLFTTPRTELPSQTYRSSPHGSRLLACIIK